MAGTTCFGKNTINFQPRVLDISKLDMKRTKGMVTAPILHLLKNIWKIEEDKLDPEGLAALEEFFFTE